MLDTPRLVTRHQSRRRPPSCRWQVKCRSGGTFEAIGNASFTPKLLSGAVFEVGSGALTSVANESGVTVKVLSGGIVSGGTVLRWKP